MTTQYLEKYFYTHLVKLILDYVNLIKYEDELSEIPDKYIGNIIIKINENKYDKEYINLIRKANIRFDKIPDTLINLTYLNCAHKC